MKIYKTPLFRFYDLDDRNVMDVFTASGEGIYGDPGFGGSETGGIY